MECSVRISFFIDGFNVYHSLDNNGLHKLKWLNYSELCTRFLNKGDVLSSVELFTAYARHDAGKRQRHSLLIEANKSVGVIPVLGRFSMNESVCVDCGYRKKRPVEKQTDTHISTSVLKRGFFDCYDRAVIVSGDSDQIPTVHSFGEMFPQKQIAFVFPLDRVSQDIRTLVGGGLVLNMSQTDLEQSQFSDTLILPNGKTLHRPREWT